MAALVVAPTLQLQAAAQQHELKDPVVAGMNHEGAGHGAAPQSTN
jgi:hypothetical protein